MKGDWNRERKWPKHRIAGVLKCERCEKEYPAMTYQIRRKQRFCSGECRYYLSDEQRFWSHVKRTDDRSCWNWTGATVSGRYGNFKPYTTPHVLSHRYSWQIHFGPIPAGQNVLHNCDNVRCVNPSHLFLGTQFDNVHDCIRKGRAWHCKKI